MKPIRIREKEFPTETLTEQEINEIAKSSESYDRGEAPVGRGTQNADGLADLAKLQKKAYEHAEAKDTHSYEKLDSEPSENPDPEHIYEPEPDIEYYDGEDSDGSAVPAEEQFILQPLDPNDEKYDDIMDNYEEVIEKMSSNPTKPKYWFKEQGDHWYCTCGHLNKGDSCANCGLERDLLRALFFLHEPGDEPGKYEGMNVTYTDVDVRDHKLTTRAKILIAIAVIVILAAVAGLYSYFYVIKPNMEKEAAAAARAMAESIEANVPACTEGMNEFLRSCYITAGDQSFEGESYERALRFYSKASSMESGDGLSEKINKSKFGYINSHKSDGGDKFEKYLGELHEIGYDGVDEIYDEYYAWHFSIVANLDPEDYETDIETASRADTVYFHVSVSGGPPGETLDIYYDAEWPSGARQTDMIGSKWSSGSKGSARFSYPVPLFAREGTLSFRIYDKNTQEGLGSDSITFSK